MDINTYDLKLKEIDKRIKDKDCVNSGWQGNNGYSCIGVPNINRETGGQRVLLPYTECNKNLPTDEYYNKINTSLSCEAYLKLKRDTIVFEMQKEQQYLKDQFILQQQQATEFARQQALKAAEEVRAAANKSEQELQKAKQELEKAKQELAKAQAAESLAKSVDAGNLESGRILMGINTANKYKLPLLIGGGIIGLGILSYAAYKIFKKK